MILPRSVWYPKHDGYIRGTYMYKEQSVVVDTIMIAHDSATVIFNYGVRRINIDAEEFRKRFEK